jgi:hypothetical protein
MGGDIKASIFKVVALSEETGETGGDCSCEVGAVRELSAVLNKNLKT